jgi:integrase
MEKMTLDEIGEHAAMLGIMGSADRCPTCDSCVWSLSSLKKGSCCWKYRMELNRKIRKRHSLRTPRCSVCFDNGAPCFRFRSGGQKSGRVELVPMAPDFAEMLLAVPEIDRVGRVFGLEYESDWASKVICRIGEAAGVVVEQGNRKGKPHVKYASAHDFRRAFGVRWSKLVMPPVLMQLMRHQETALTPP